MVREEVVRAKLALLHGYLAELERHRNISFQEYSAGGDKQRAIERLLQLLVETSVDINVHISTEVEGVPPADYTESFRAVARCNAISVELANRLSPSAGLRNALVHEYGDLDMQKVHAAIPMALDGFREYANQINGWFKTKEKKP